MGFWNQLGVLLWKNFTIRKRQKWRLFAEFVSPLGLFLILVVIRMRPDLKILHPECHFDGRAMPSAGTLPFLQSFFCTFNNTCHRNKTTSELPGNAAYFNQSVLTRLIEDASSMINAHIDNKLIKDVQQDWQTFSTIKNKIFDDTARGSIKVGTLLFDPVKTKRYMLNIPDIIPSQEMLDGLNNLTYTLKTTGVKQLTGFLQDFDACPSIEQVNSAEDIKNLICLSGGLSQLFEVADHPGLQRIQHKLCNMKSKHLLRYYQEFKSEFSLKSVFFEIFKYVFINSGHLPNIANVLLKLQNIFQDMKYLNTFNTPEWKSLSGDLNTDNIMESLGLFVCGSNSFLKVDTEENNDIMSKFQASKDKAVDDSDKDLTNDYGPDSPVCRNLVNALNANFHTKVLWNQLRTVILGKIPYAPDTPAVRKIIRQANETFSDMYRVVQLGEAWGEYVDDIFSYMDSDSNLDLLRAFSNSCICDMFEKGLQSAAKTNQKLSDWLNSSSIGLCDGIKQIVHDNTDMDTTQWRHIFNYTRQFARMMANYGPCFLFNKFVGYPTEEALIEDSMAMVENKTLWAALVFDVGDKNKLPSHITYKIRMDIDRVDSSKQVMDRLWTPGSRSKPGEDTKFLTYGFAYLQDIVDHAIIKLQTGITDGLGVVLQQFPYPCYIQDNFMIGISMSLPLFLVLAWVWSVAMLSKNVVYEKEKRLKEVMKIMGLSNGVHWVAWFITSFTVMFLTVCLLTFVITAGRVIEHSDPFIVLLFMTVFAVATIMQCFFFSVFFSQANIAACCAGFLYFVLYLPYVMVKGWEELMFSWHKFLVCTSSSVAFGFGCTYIARFEEQAVGIQWDNIASSPMVDDHFNMFYCILMMLIDTVIYALLTWYIEAVFPGQYGVPRPWYFFLQKSYWCGTSRRLPVRHVYENNIRDASIDMDWNGLRTSPKQECNSDGGFYLRSRRQEVPSIYKHHGMMGSRNNFYGGLRVEPEPTDRRLGVAIRNLKKVYKQGNKVAVDGLNINFYEGQITSFLGHNGAGKTTTMSVLTGLFPPTDGTAYIYGRDIRTQMNDIRHSLGVCPQHNVLFDLLSVEEHLWFFAQLKGLSLKKSQKDMEKMLKDLDLLHKRKEFPKALSGGMKRMLSVAMAFVGNAKTVILDEPTAGVDPYARRAIWDLLLKFKSNRTIILSTHHMDEADMLGDRIAIISHGKLRCCGSSLFLKSQYGNGYYLTLVKNSSTDKEHEEVVKKYDSILESQSLPDMYSSIARNAYPTIGPGGVVTDFDDEGFADTKTESSDVDSLSPVPEGATMIPGFSVHRLAAFIQKFVPNSQLVEDHNSELTFQLSSASAHDGGFVTLFKELEKCYKDLGISSFGISDTRLEEVFLRVAKETETNEPNGDEHRQNMIEDITDEVTGSTENFHHQQCYKVDGKLLVFRQFIALLIKRFHHFRKSKKGFLCEIVMPALFILMAMFFSETNPPFTDPPPLELHPWHYTPDRGDQHIYSFYSIDSQNSYLGDKAEKLLLSFPGIGNRCMNPDIKTVDKFSCESRDKSHTAWTGIRPADESEDPPECSCATGVQHCPMKWPEPPKTYLASADYMYNMTGLDVSDWLVKTTNRYIKRRYGGLSISEGNVFAKINASQIQTAFERLSLLSSGGHSKSKRDLHMWSNFQHLLEKVAIKNVSKVWFNNKGWIAGISYMNVMNNLLLRSYLPSGKDPRSYGITTIHHPMNLTKQQLSEQAIYNAETDSVVAICVIFAMCFIPASFVMILIEERVSNSKHLQFVSGVNPSIYWISNFVWDMINYSIPAVLCILIFVIFDKEAYVGPRNLPCLITLMFLYGWAMIPLMYPFSRVFNVPSTAMVTLKSISIFLGTTSTLATFILDCLEEDDKGLKNVNHILRQVLLILPQYCLGRGLLDMSRNQMHADSFKRFGVDKFVSPFEWSQVGRNLFSLFSLGVLFFTINLLIEYNFFCNKEEKISLGSKTSSDEDIDVTRERKRLLQGGAKDDVVRVHNLTKVYRVSGKKDKYTAVDHLCFGVPSGQCFGLLGVNGAGKSTTFQMLTGEVSMTTGNAFIHNRSIIDDLIKVRKDIGYCPQFDAFDPLMTAEEVLSFYARLRGIPESEVSNVADWAIKKLGLSQYADKMSGNYSGGNRRKLSTAISLIGNPSVIFLDEPTTGMDPRARRFLWNCINNIVKDGRSVILTSHSMEECEALCGRLAIMVNGKFSCIGSTQHLKNRFGDGYTVMIRVSGEHPDLHPVEEFICNTFTCAVLKERHHNLLHYQLGSSVKLSYIFGQIEAVRKSFNIEDYSVTQTTLDQVFINFAKKQTDLPDDEFSSLPKQYINKAESRSSLYQFCCDTVCCYQKKKCRCHFSKHRRYYSDEIDHLLSDIQDLERGELAMDTLTQKKDNMFIKSTKSAIKIL